MSNVTVEVDLTPPRYQARPITPKTKPSGLSLKRVILAFIALSFILAGFGIWLVPAQIHQPGEALLRLAISLVLLIFGLSMSLWARLSR